MSDILLLAAIVMLVLLFLKVPVYLAVLGGSMVYFAPVSYTHLTLPTILLV